MKDFIRGLSDTAEGLTIVRMDERALPGAYAVGQTDLDGMMVVYTCNGYASKGEAPWTGDTGNATE